MGAPLYKDIKDVKEFKEFKDQKEASEVDLRVRLPIDPIGPVKYDVADRLVQTYLELLPAVAQRIDAIEEHLEMGLPEGKPFVRQAERPDVGGQAVGDLAKAVSLLGERLQGLEQKIK